jgi:predicted transcriptional regulator
MAMTLRLTDEEQEGLKACASDFGMSMQDVARQAIREYIIRVDHRSKVSGATDLIMSVHADALERLGQ